MFDPIFRYEGIIISSWGEDQICSSRWEEHNGRRFISQLACLHTIGSIKPLMYRFLESNIIISMSRSVPSSFRARLEDFSASDYYRYRFSATREGVKGCDRGWGLHTDWLTDWLTELIGWHNEFFWGSSHRIPSPRYREGEIQKGR